MKYRAIRDSYGFMGRFWNQGEIVDLPPGEKPNKHFEPADSAESEIEVEPPAASEPAPVSKKRSVRK